ncbi:MAG: rhodanese-like domain-containing protein [Cellvibrionales bacterium]|nr:rhodanese-like domain-containing protein [Cellvibrionales bacterium]
MNELPAIISPEELNRLMTDNHETNRQGMLIIDLCQKPEYQSRSIPQAIHIDPSELVYGDKPVTGLLPPKESLQSLFRRIGLTQDSQVVVYDDAKGTWACRLIWTLDVLGFEKTTLLNGGMDAWVNASLPLTKGYAEPKGSQINLSIDKSQVVDKAYILNALNHNQLTVWDARSDDEFNGTKALAKRSGHIPGALHYEWVRLLDKEGKVRDLQDLQMELATLGFDPAHELITHCQTHRRSSLTYFVAKKLLGYDKIKAYPGSWAEWGNADETPVAS